MILVRRKSQVEATEGQNKFELKHYNIIHAPADTSKHFINIFETLPDETNKTANGRNKRPGYSRKFNMLGRNGWSFCSLFCERLCRFSALDTSFIFIFWLKWIALFANLIAQPTYCKNKTWDTYRNLQSVIEEVLLFWFMQRGVINNFIAGDKSSPQF